MKKIISIISLILTFNCCAELQAQWFQLNSGTNADLYSVYFVNNQIGYVAGGNGIIKTSNGGLNWFNQYNISSSSVQFINSNTGFAISGNGIIKTLNGGQNWSAFQTPFGAASISIVDSAIGYGCGSNAHIMKTFDGGLTWYSLDPGITTYNFSSIYFTNRNVGFVVGGYQIEPYTYGIIRATTNGGVSWFTSYSGSNLFTSVYFINEDTGWVTSGQQILKTINRGVSWSISSTASLNYFYSVHFPNPDTGYAAGSNEGPGGGGIIWKTTNGGANWFQSFFFQYYSFFSIHFPGATTGYAAGQSGNLVKTTDGGLTFINNFNENIPKNFLLNQNYPNPFNPTTKIRFSIPPYKGGQGDVLLKVYDLLGHEVATLVSEKLQPGNYEVEFPAPAGNATNFSSGIYFYKLSTENYTETKKMVLIK